MLSTFLKHSARVFKRQKGYLAINIFGLSIGIACSVIIALFVIYELSYDRYNEKTDRIYRVILNGKLGGQEITAASTTAAIGPAMLTDLPEIEDFVRLNNLGSTVIKIDNQSFIEERAIQADSSFFNFFSIPLLQGDPRKVLNAPYLVVISETSAQRYFKEQNPIGKTMKIGTDNTLYTVTGIMEDIPDNTHFNANLIGSFMTNPRSRDPEWMSNSYSTYVLLKPNTKAIQVDDKLQGMIVKYIGPLIEQFLGTTLKDWLSAGNKYRFYLQPLREIHLDPGIEQMHKPAANPRYLYIFGSIALLILLIAAINYMNLSTAQAAKRAREVGIKKVSGSTRQMLINQFLSESLLLTMISLLIAVVIIELALPSFSNIMHARLKVGYFEHWYTLPALFTLAIFLGFLSGTYPAFYLSKFKPISVLKGNLRNGMKNGVLRSVLVVFQFTVSIILIIGTTVMYRQIHFLLSRDLGFDKNNLLVVEGVEALGNQAMAFKEEVIRIPGVANASLSTAIPGRNNNNNGYLMEDRNKDETFLMNTSWADFDYLKTYGMQLADGREMRPEFSTDSFACIINQSAMNNFNMRNPLQERFILPSPRNNGEPDYRSVIGVVKDFHHESLHSPINPYIILFRTDRNQFGYFTARIDPTKKQEVIAAVEKEWKKFTNNDPIQYYFFDQDFDNQYREEKQNALLAILFTILAIMVATLGLFGLTSFTLVQRTKEIGIRKIMGASIGRIFILITREISVLVGIATLIAWPVIYFVAKNWLNNFYYRINLRISDFLIGFFIALIIALLTISYRTLRAATANPAKALKYE